jgi:hypothetical protein
MGGDGGASGRGWTGRAGRRGKAKMREDLFHDGRIRDGGDQAASRAGSCGSRTAEYTSPWRPGRISASTYACKSKDRSTFRIEELLLVAAQGQDAGPAACSRTIGQADAAVAGA